MKPRVPPPRERVPGMLADLRLPGGLGAVDGNWRDRSCTGSSRKSRRTTSRLRATVHRWPSPSGPAGKAWPGENVDEPSSPAFTTGPSTATFFSKLSVMFRSSLDTSIKPILCPRKSGPTQHQTCRQSFARSVFLLCRQFTEQLTMIVCQAVGLLTKVGVLPYEGSYS